MALTAKHRLVPASSSRGNVVWKSRLPCFLANRVYPSVLLLANTAPFCKVRHAFCYFTDATQGRKRKKIISVLFFLSGVKKLPLAPSCLSKSVEKLSKNTSDDLKNIFSVIYVNIK